MSHQELKEFGDTLRQLIQHEGQLLTNRLGWLLTAESALFAALGLSWEYENQWLVYVIALIGFLTSISVFLSMQLALGVQSYFEKRWQLKCWSFNEDPDNLPPIVGKSRAEVGFIHEILLPWRMIPILLALGWIAIAVIALTSFNADNNSANSEAGGVHLIILENGCQLGDDA